MLPLTRTLVLTAASVPLAVATFLWTGALRSRDLRLSFEPSEIDRQLRERNDDPDA